MTLAFLLKKIKKRLVNNSIVVPRRNTIVQIQTAKENYFPKF